MAIAIGADTLGAVLGQVQSISLGDIASQMAIGAIATAALSGIKSDSGQNALDPLHIFHKDGSQTVVGGKTIPASVFTTLAPDARAQMMAAGYAVVAG